MDNFRRRAESESTQTVKSKNLYFTSITVQSNNLQSQSGIVSKGTSTNTWFCPVVGTVEVIAEYDIVNKLSNGNEVVVKHDQRNITLQAPEIANIVMTYDDNTVVISGGRLSYTSSGWFRDPDYELDGGITFHMIYPSGGGIQTSAVHFDHVSNSDDPDVIQWNLMFYADVHNQYDDGDFDYYKQISGTVGSCTLTRLSNTQIQFDFNPVPKTKTMTRQYTEYSVYVDPSSVVDVHTNFQSNVAHPQANLATLYAKYRYYYRDVYVWDDGSITYSDATLSGPAVWTFDTGSRDYNGNSIYSTTDISFIDGQHDISSSCKTTILVGPNFEPTECTVYNNGSYVYDATSRTISTMTLTITIDIAGRTFTGSTYTVTNIYLG